MSLKKNKINECSYKVIFALLIILYMKYFLEVPFFSKPLVYVFDVLKTSSNKQILLGNETFFVNWQYFFYRTIYSILIYIPFGIIIKKTFGKKIKNFNLIIIPIILNLISFVLKFDDLNTVILVANTIGFFIGLKAYEKIIFKFSEKQTIIFFFICVILCAFSGMSDDGGDFIGTASGKYNFAMNDAQWSEMTELERKDNSDSLPYDSYNKFINNYKKGAYIEGSFGGYSSNGDIITVRIDGKNNIFKLSRDAEYISKVRYNNGFELYVSNIKKENVYNYDDSDMSRFIHFSNSMYQTVNLKAKVIICLNKKKEVKYVYTDESLFD
ncbi:hypothetical protein [Peptostreptococcus faecalis]|uniref:hypothetical protein n=1 Tax=Peptostreptococcus faecalis TaxID=2045015 RepID=UPI000C7CBDAB|nr:hypothetical protein [Peptostreptococcus faecalis]